MPEAQINGIRMHFEHGGSGPRLLFINGSGATLAGSGPLLKPFRDRFELLAYDQRGMGETEVPDAPSTMADCAADAAALVEHVGWHRCAVAGISFGGMVAQELAVTHPDRIERLALLCTSPGGPDTSSYPLHELAQLTRAEREQVQLEILDSRFDDEWLATHELDRLLAETMRDRARAEKSADQRRGEAAQLAARAGHDVRDRLHLVTCPTFVAAGRFDGIAPLANSEAIVDRVPGAELHVYEGGHLFVLQDPAAVLEILDFLDPEANGT
jgi:pimeloyl-ACP methyl ester carboxylesterase